MKTLAVQSLRFCQRICALMLLAGVAASLPAQIPVNFGPGPVIDFTTTPPATEWTTHDAVLPGTSATYSTPAELDVAAQTISASAINSNLFVRNSTGTFRFAQHNNAGGYVFTQPATAPAVVLMARLRNNSGTTLELLSVSYQFSVLVTPVLDSVPGQRAFWSLTGQPGSWVSIPEFSGRTSNATLNALLELGAWLPESEMYLLWLDDNNETGTDGCFALDNVVFSGGLVSPVNITDQPDDLTVPERGPAVFNVSASGLPRDYFWLRNGVPIPGARSASYTNPPAIYPGDNGAVFSVIVSNQLGSQTSTGAVLTVLPDTNPPVALRALGDFARTTVTVSFSEPIQPGTVEPSSFRIFPTGTDPNETGTPATTASVSNLTNVVLQFASPYAAEVNHSILLFDVQDTAHTPNVVALTVRPLQQLVELIDFNGLNNLWHYSTETNLFGTGWETTGHDDALWPSGPAGFGRDTSMNGVPIRTDAYPVNDSAPQFFRRHFYLNAHPASTALSMRHVFEDGAVVYINGQEAGRFNVAAGALSVTTRTPLFTSDPTPISGVFSLPVTNLVAGDNVIAVVVFQSGATSSDCEMALELTATVTEFASGPLVITAQPQSQSVNEGANVTLTVAANGALPVAYQWRRNGVPIPGATNATHSMPNLSPSQAGSFDVLLTNALGFTNSAVANVTVACDCLAPAFVGAVGSLALTNITLTITDAFGLDVASATNPGHYTVQRRTGGGALAVTSAVLLNATNVLLTSSPRLPGVNYDVTLSGVTDRSEARNAAVPATRPVQATVLVFDYNHVWRYDQSGLDLGTSWKEPGYDDAVWPSGLGFLAFENTTATLTLFTNLAGGAGNNTVLSLNNNTQAGIGGTNITFYFRTAFSLSNFNPVTSGNVMRATSYMDDGGAIYVNGLEAMRFNLTNAANYTNFATVSVTEGASGLITSNLLGFVAGQNVIAAEVHQNSITSADVAWGLRLEALVSEFTHGDPILRISASGGNIIILWTGGGTLQRSSDLGSPLNWENVPGSPTSPFTNSTAGPSRFYRVVGP